MVSTSALRPTKAAGRTTRRPGSGTVDVSAAGTHATSTDGTGSGMPFSSSAPTGTNVWPLERAMRATSSVVRICPPSAFAHSRAASTTGGPK
jgi:hypothetical protein